MRKFVNRGAVKYTDNDIKARNLLSIGYKEVKADTPPKFDAQTAAEPNNEDAETVEVSKGKHTTEEPTTDKVEAAAAAGTEEPKKTTKKTASKKN